VHLISATPTFRSLSAQVPNDGASNRRLLEHALPARLAGPHDLGLRDRPIAAKPLRVAAQRGSAP